MHMNMEIMVRMFCIIAREEPWFQWEVDAGGANLSESFFFSIGAFPDKTKGYISSTSFYIKKNVTEAKTESTSLSLATSEPLYAQPASVGSATVGLAVGLSIAFLIIAAGVSFVFYRRSRRKVTQKKSPTIDSEQALEVREYAAVPQVVRRSDSPVELPAVKDSVELAGSTHTRRGVEEQDEWVQSTRT